MANDQKLLPCPFCGSANVAQGASGDWISVWCFCGAQGPSVPFPEINPEPIIAIHKCFEAWNSRAASIPAKPVGELVEKLTANRTVSMTWPDAALLAIQAEQNMCLDAASALTTLAAEMDALAKKNSHWAAAASYGDGSPMFTPERLEKSIIAMLARATTAETALTTSQAQVATLTAALEFYAEPANYKGDLIPGYTDEGGSRYTLTHRVNKVRADAGAMARAALNPKAPS